MSEKEDQGDPVDVGDLTENAEYEDDFEKDLECLTDEEENQNLGEIENPGENKEDSEAQIPKAAESFEEDNEEIENPGENKEDSEAQIPKAAESFEKDNEGIENPGENKEDSEAQIPKAAESFEEDSEEMEENLDQLSEADVDVKVIYTNEKCLELREDTEQEDHESDTERESFIEESGLENEPELDEKEDEEIKRYVLEKIEEANKELENQAPVDQKRERKLKFKDELVDLQAPPPEDAEAGKADVAEGDDVSSGLSQLRISNDTGQKRTSVSAQAGSDEETTDGKILVEKDGKFEVLSVCDIESQGITPPISVSFTDIETQHTSRKLSQSSSSHTGTQMKELPPSDSKHHPDTVSNAAKDLGKEKSPQRTQSSNTPMRTSTYTLTPKQKELRKLIEQRNERLRREEEERKRELEEERRRENDVVYRAWLQKKKEQLQEEKRIRRAKRLEELSLKEGSRDPEEAYRLWLKKKHQQYVKEKRIEILRRQAEEVPFIPRTEECNRAFKEWLRKKREEKRAEELAAKERARQLRLEARRARQMRSIHYA